jgi:DNA-binding MarR family transcriptional regulator
MRSHRDIQNSNRHNQTKFLILRIFAYPPINYLTSYDIAEQCGLSQNNVSRALKRLVGQGYIWRKDIGKKSYRYRFLKPMGERVIKQLWIRNRLAEKTGEQVDLHLKKSIPNSLLSKIEQEYNQWLYGQKSNLKTTP